MSATANEQGVGEGGFRLSASPSPFQRSTTLTLDVPTAGPVTVGVFDMLGRRVVALHEGDLTVGSHALVFEVKDLPGGVYVVRAMSANRRQTHTVTLLR